MVNVGKEGVSEVNEALDRGYVLKALTDLRDKLIRAKAREVPGTEIARLRQREVDYLTGLISRSGG